MALGAVSGFGRPRATDMTVHAIKVPDLGEGVAEVELVAWRVNPGDRVVEDQALADVMTDKATVEVPSPVAGRVLALGGEVGQRLAVGAELIRIDVGDATATAHTAPEISAGQPAASEAPASVARAGVAPASELPLGIESTQPPARHRPIASPAIRARAWELGIDLNDMSGSGMAGRIVQADLDAFVARGAARSKPQAPPPRLAAPSETTHAVKIVGLRRRIAQRMQDSKRRIPHFTYVEEVDVSELEALRAQLNAKWGALRGHLTLLPFLSRAIAQAVREFPQVNSHFDDVVDGAIGAAFVQSLRQHLEHPALLFVE